MMHQIFDRYSVYKDSEVYWVQEIPSTWEILHLKNCVSKKITDGPHTTPIFLDDGVPFLSAEAVQDGGLNFEAKRGFISVDDDKIYSLKCKPKRNDILFVKSGSTTGKIAYVSTDENFNIWSPLALIRVRRNFHPRYMFHFLSSSFFQKQVQISWSFGTQPNIGMGVIEGLQVLVPSLAEQISIAAYLDTKIAQLDRKIALLSQKVTLYGKLKQSLIEETVTRGLNKSAPMKDSGILWIGEVPAHWDIRRAKDLFERKVRPCFDDDEIVTAFRDGHVTLRLNRRVTGFTNAIKEHGYQRIHVGDLVIHAMDAFAGAIGVSDSTGKSSPVYSAYTAMDKDKVYMPYYGKLIRQMALSGFISSLGKGIRERSTEFRHNEFLPLELVVPPLEEQIAIAAYLDTKTAQIDSIVTTINTQIDKLKELRKTLINDVVTGNIKVVQEG